MGLVLNGIPDIASRGDLADRAVVLTAPEIPDESRREESELDQEFVTMAPAVLGALLDGVAAGVRGRAAVAAAMKRKPRMADFAVFAAASAPGFGWTREEFEEAYGANRNARVARVVEADAVAEAIHRLVIEADAAPREGGGRSGGRVPRANSSRSSRRRYPREPGGNGGGRRVLRLCRTASPVRHPDCDGSESASRKTDRQTEQSRSTK